MSKDYFIHRAGTAEVMEDGFYELSGAEKIASDLAHQNPGVEFYVAMRYTRFLVEPARPADDGTATELAADTAKVMLRGLEQAPGRVVGSNPFETEADWRARVESRLAALEQAMWPLQSHPVAAARADLRAHRHSGGKSGETTGPNP